MAEARPSEGVSVPRATELFKQNSGLWEGRNVIRTSCFSLLLSACLILSASRGEECVFQMIVTLCQGAKQSCQLQVFLNPRNGCDCPGLVHMLMPGAITVAREMGYMPGTARAKLPTPAGESAGFTR